MPADKPQHAIRDGDYPIIYVTGEKALFKFFPAARWIGTMKTFAPGDLGHMTGYAGLNVADLPLPPILVEGPIEVLAWTRHINKAGASTGGVWHFVPGADEETPGTWTLKNGGLPENWRWVDLATDPSDKDHWMIYGSPEDTAEPVGLWSNDKIYVDAPGSPSPFWQTHDAGLTWTEYIFPPPLADELADNISTVNLSYGAPRVTRCKFVILPNGDPFMMGSVYGMGVWFGTATAGLMRWNVVDGVKTVAKVADPQRTPSPTTSAMWNGDEDDVVAAYVQGDADTTYGITGHLGAWENASTATPGWYEAGMAGGSFNQFAPTDMVALGHAPGTGRRGVGIQAGKPSKHELWVTVDYRGFSSPDAGTTLGLSDNSMIGTSNDLGQGVAAMADGSFYFLNRDGVWKFTVADPIVTGQQEAQTLPPNVSGLWKVSTLRGNRQSGTTAAGLYWWNNQSFDIGVFDGVTWSRLAPPNEADYLVAVEPIGSPEA